MTLFFALCKSFEVVAVRVAAAPNELFTPAGFGVVAETTECCTSHSRRHWLEAIGVDALRQTNGVLISRASA